MTKGKVVLLAAATVIGGNFLASKNGTFRSLWSK